MGAMTRKHFSLRLPALRRHGSWAGIEVGQVAVKFVVLSRRHGRVVIDHFAYLEVPEPSSPHRETALREAFQEIRDGCPVRKLGVAAVAGDKDVAVHMIQLPKGTPPSRFRQAAIFQAMGQAPDDQRDLVWNAVRQGVDDQDRPQALVTSAPRVVIENLCRLLREFDLEPDLVTVPPLSLFLLAPEDATCGNTAVVDIGCRTTTVAIFRERRLLYSRDTRVGSGLITQELARRLGGDTALAEMVKRQWTLPRPGEAVEPVYIGSDSYTIDPSEIESVKLLTEELVRSLRYVEDRVGIPIQQVVLSGGGSQLKGLGAYLDIPQSVVVADAGHEMFPPISSPTVNRPLLEALAPSLTRAVCVAHLGLLRPPWARLNLLVDHRTKTNQTRFSTDSPKSAWVRAAVYGGLFVASTYALVQAAEGNLERKRDALDAVQAAGADRSTPPAVPPEPMAPWARGLAVIGASLPPEIELDRIRTIDLKDPTTPEPAYDPELSVLFDPEGSSPAPRRLALGLEGSATTRRAVGDFLVALRRAPEVVDAYLEWTRRPEEGGSLYMRFSLVAILDDASPDGRTLR
jgi:Tfp pilus assembly PilM family ATPase